MKHAAHLVKFNTYFPAVIKVSKVNMLEPNVKTFNFVLTNEAVDRINPGFVSIQWPIIPSSFPPEVDPQEVLAPPHPPVVWLPPRPALKPPSRAVSPLPASAGILVPSDPGGATGKPRHKPVGGPVIEGVNDSEIFTIFRKRH